MLTLLSRKATDRIVDHGRVWCPRGQRDVDFDVCAVCSRNDAVVHRQGHDWVVCNPGGGLDKPVT